MANKNLRSLTAYTSCQTRLLSEEITQKKSLVRQQFNELSLFKNNLKERLNLIDFTHVCSLFLTGNDKSLKKHQEVHDKKISQLVKVRSKTTNSSDKVIFNFSSHNLSEHEKSVLSKGLNFAISPSKINYADYLVNFELLFRDIKKLDLSTNDLDFVKTKIKDIALSSFRTFDTHHNISNLSEEEFAALKEFSKKLDLVIQKSDKGNSVVLVDKIAYLQRVLKHSLFLISFKLLIYYLKNN